MSGSAADRSDREEQPTGLWFGRRGEHDRFGPLTWQGRAATALYVFLLLVAVITYSQLSLTALVVGFYSVAYGLVVVVKSDLLKDWPPGS